MPFEFNSHRYTAGYDGAVRVYDETTQKLRATLRGGDSFGGGVGGGGHTNRVFGVKYARHDENVIVSGGWDNTVQVWDERCGGSGGGGAVRQMFGPHVCGDALDVARSESGSATEILAGSWRGFFFFLFFFF